MSKEYGYTRISTPKQNIDRQVRNILAAHPQAHMIKEVFTGTKFQGRKELDKLLRTVKPGDTIIFDSVSRMSRNAEEGFLLYQDLFNQGINLVFLKEPHINTDTYKRALQGGIPTTGTNVDFIGWREQVSPGIGKGADQACIRTGREGSAGLTPENRRGDRDGQVSR